uniref:Dolichol-phosphate mannosyltransferase subunit 3 n=1 Tax=Heterorhabditis bacteriophora TaxID=37862 RepID=A0A1I7XSN3_HETBA
MVSQAAIYFFHIFPAILLWFLSVMEFIPVLKYGPEFMHHYILYAPLYATLLLAVYAICSIIYAVATFNDCAAAKAELIQEIKEAREDLKKRNII